MLRRFRLLDGLRGRIAIALFAAVLVQFVGSEIIFAKAEETRIERGRSQRLADWLLFADAFFDTRPDAVERMNAMWEPRLLVARRDAPPPSSRGEATADIVALQPGLRELDFRADRDGEALEGTIRLTGGGWLSFRSEDYFQGSSLLYHYSVSLILLVLIVLLLALVFGRVIGRPLEHIAVAAERVGGDERVAVEIDGPLEVRQVAAAFDRMQTRLLDHIGERVQSLAAMSHDLRTPLARLRLNASTVDDADTRAALEQDIAEMEAFVTSILDYLRGDDPEPEQPIDIASIAMTVVDEASDAGGDVSYAGPDRLEAMMRPLKLKKLLRNVVQNAVRHAGNARLNFCREGRELVFTIDDDGPGIPADKLAEVFEPFTRVENSRSRSTGGAGLGLAVARQLSRRMTGHIKLENRPAGGLVVTIRLPYRPGQS